MTRAKPALAVRSAALAVALLLAPPLPAGAAPADLERPGTIHLDRPQGAGFVRPEPRDPGCLARALAGEPDVAGLDARARFMVQRDGALTGIELEPAAPAAMTRAAVAALRACPWRPGLDPGGRPVVVQVTQPIRVRAASHEDGEAGQERAGAVRSSAGRADAPGLPPPPVVMGEGRLRLDGPQAAGFRRPVLDDPGCLPRALQRQPAVAGLENTVKFAVMRDGSVSHFSFLVPVPPEVDRAVAAAFEACSWRPALDPAGQPLAVWVVQPLKVAPALPPPEKQRPLFP